LYDALLIIIAPGEVEFVFGTADIESLDGLATRSVPVFAKNYKAVHLFLCPTCIFQGAEAEQFVGGCVGDAWQSHDVLRSQIPPSSEQLATQDARHQLILLPSAVGVGHLCRIGALLSNVIGHVVPSKDESLVNILQLPPPGQLCSFCVHIEALLPVVCCLLHHPIHQRHIVASQFGGLTVVAISGFEFGANDVVC